MASIVRALLIGSLYTFLSFALSLLFLNFATMFWFHQTAFEFLSDLDASRSNIQEQTALTNPGSFQAIVLQDKVFYFIITLVVFSIWALNVNRQYNKEDSSS
jgi:hypothetical protein